MQLKKGILWFGLWCLSFSAVAQTMRQHTLSGRRFPEKSERSVRSGTGMRERSFETFSESGWILGGEAGLVASPVDLNGVLTIGHGIASRGYAGGGFGVQGNSRTGVAVLLAFFEGRYYFSSGRTVPFGSLRLGALFGDLYGTGIKATGGKEFLLVSPAVGLQRAFSRFWGCYLLLGYQGRYVLSRYRENETTAEETRSRSERWEHGFVVSVGIRFRLSFSLSD